MTSAAANCDTGAASGRWRGDNEAVRILDGGSGFEAAMLCAGRLEINKHVSWSSRLLHDDPAVVSQIYRRFLEAGAEVITSVSYQADPDTLSAGCGVSVERAEQLMRDSVQLAKREVADWAALAERGGGAHSSRPILVAASLGPFGAILADGSEYSGAYLDYTPPERIRASYERRAAILEAAQPDLLAFETIPSAAELQIVLELMRDRPNMAAWISMSCPSGTHTARGDSLADAVDLVNRLATRNVVAFGVNCVVPLLAVKAAVRQIRSRLLPWIQVIVYPNNGEEICPDDDNWFFPDGVDEDTFYRELPGWIEEGARWVGGCCKMSSTRMVRVAELVRAYRARQQGRRGPGDG